jgi:hypothetical protein
MGCRRNRQGKNRQKQAWFAGHGFGLPPSCA